MQKWRRGGYKSIHGRRACIPKQFVWAAWDLEHEIMKSRGDLRDDLRRILNSFYMNQLLFTRIRA